MRAYRYESRDFYVVTLILSMALLAALGLYGYDISKNVFYLLLFFSSLGVVYLQMYKLLCIRILLGNDRVVYKSLTKEYVIKKPEIYDIQILRNINNQLIAEKYNSNDRSDSYNNSCYVLIRKEGFKLRSTLSIFNVGNENFISLKYRRTLEPDLEQLLA